MSLAPVIAVLPGGGLPPIAEVLAAVERELDKAAPLVQRDLQATTATWDHDVDFRVETPRPGVRTIATTDRIWRYVNDGTEPHQIKPKPGGVLRFGTPYRPKSAVGSTVARAGGAGGNIVFTGKPVQHPGTEARDFSGQIAKEWQNRLPARVSAAVAAVIKGGR